MFNHLSPKLNPYVIYRGFLIIHLSHENDKDWSFHAAKTLVSVQQSQRQLLRAGIPGMWQTGETQVAVGLSSDSTHTQWGFPAHTYTHAHEQIHLWSHRLMNICCCSCWKSVYEGEPYWSPLSWQAISVPLNNTHTSFKEDFKVTLIFYQCCVASGW